MHQKNALKRRFAPGRGTCALLLLAAGLFFFACGDFTYTGGGNLPPPGPAPEPPAGLGCPHPFLGVSAFKNLSETALDITLKDPVTVAVVPDQMSFSFTPKNSSTAVQAVAGDLMVTDRDSDEIYFYAQSAANIPVIFPSGTLDPYGLAFFLEEVDVSGTKEKVQLLLYTGTNTSTGNSNLYIYDLNSGTSLAPNPFKIPDDARSLIPGLTKFVNAQAVAVGRSTKKRGIFVTDNKQKVYRITLGVSGTVPVPESMATLATGFTSLRDVAFSNQTQSVYLSATSSSVVYRVKSAMTSSSVDKSQLSNFIPPSQILQPTGLNLAPTNTQGTASDLLVVSQQTTRGIGQFNTSNGNIALGYLAVSSEGHQDVAYDCTNTRIVFTRKTFSPGVYQYKK